jgi:hypothetical protein
VATVSSGLTSKHAATVFTGLASKSVTTVFAGLASKLMATVSSGLTSKPATIFSIFASKLVVTVSPGLASKPVVGFLVEPQNQGGGGFPGLGLKTDNSDLVIWVWFGFKTKQTSVYRLRHKINGGRSARDTRQDLATCFMWKQV